MSSTASQSSGGNVGGGATPISARSEAASLGISAQLSSEPSKPRTQKEEDEEAFKELVRRSFENSICIDYISYSIFTI